MNDNITLKEVQKSVDGWIKKYGVRYFDIKTNLAMLMEEVGEVARIIGRVHGEQSLKEGEKISDLSDELADVFWVLACIANQTGVDLSKAFIENMQKKTQRDAKRHMKNKKLSNN